MILSHPKRVVIIVYLTTGGHLFYVGNNELKQLRGRIMVLTVV